ncbi:MAG TPA: diadenylate cyclase [Candidatus Glassbacteria bacterium]|nr:diadenylate cyclase [Candidatus Glassbacteria bacterium]
MNRYESEETKKELISSLYYIFPIENTIDLDKEEVKNALTLTKKHREGGQYLFWDKKDNGIVAVLYDNEKPHEAFRGFLINVINKPQALDLSFGNYFCKVFNDDIKVIPSQVTYSELWLSLRQSQFRRAIAKFSTFSTIPMIRWMQIIENSVSLKYENKPFSFCLLMTKKKKWIRSSLGNSFIPFSQKISFEKGIMAEKWLRVATSGQTVGIAGYGHGADLFGMFAIPSQSNSDVDTLLSPHEEIISITNLLVEGTCIFLTTDKGDIYLILANRATFYKTQGRWHYLNYLNIHAVLTNLFHETIASSILRLALNLSFERQGALIVIPDDNDKLEEIIPDFSQKNQINKDLRSTIKGLNVTNKIQRKIIMSSAKIDGALVISSKGQTLDVSCMIGEPAKSKLDEMKIVKLERFSGARSTAAWNASIYGTAIKISEDGPITIFRHGKLIAHVG